jgi:16S rRNA (guanine966-N2)-methyltransferase
VRENLEHLGLRAEVLRIPALRALNCTPISDRQYDLVFLDPPYSMASSLGPELSRELPPILAPDARVVAESDRRAPLELELPLLRERHYGDTLIRVHGAQ